MPPFIPLSRFLRRPWNFTGFCAGENRRLALKYLLKLFPTCIWYVFSFICAAFLISFKVPYHPKYRRLFSDAFDIYLEVVRAVDKLVKVALGHHSENWRVLNACPACSYEVWSNPHITFFYLADVSQLEGEPELVFQ